MKKTNLKWLKWTSLNMVMALSVIIAMLITGCTKSNDALDNAGNKNTVSIQAKSGVSTSNESGNTASNLINGGLVAEQGDWIIYNNGRGLYKIKKDGTERTHLSEDYAKYINVVDDWVYYKSASKTGGDYGIFRVKLNAQDSEKSDSNSINTAPELILEEGGTDITVIGDWIYHTIYKTSNEMYRVKTDGTGREKLYADNSGRLNVVSDWIFFNRKGISKVRIDGTGLTDLYTDQYLKGYGATNLIVYGEYIYYIEGIRLERLNIDGSDKTTISAEKMAINCFNIVDDYIYFTGSTDSVSGVYKMKLDGTEFGLISAGNYTSNIYIVDDWIYTQEGGFDGDFNRIKIDGTVKELVE